MFFVHGMHVRAKDITTLSSDHVRNAAHSISTVPDGFGDSSGRPAAAAEGKADMSASTAYKK